MNPYILTLDEKEIISELKNSKLSSEEMWEHSSIKKLKSNIKKHYLKEQGNKCAYCQV